MNGSFERSRFPLLRYTRIRSYYSRQRRGIVVVLEVVEVGTVEAWLDLYTDSSRNVSSKIEPRHKGVTRFRPRVNVAIRGRKSGRL